MNQLSFLSLVALWLLVFLFMSFSHRIKILSFRELSIEMERVEEARKEVEAREEHIRNMAAAIVELAEASEGGYKQPTWDAERYEKAKNQIRSFLH